MQARFRAGLYRHKVPQLLKLNRGKLKYREVELLDYCAVPVVEVILALQDRHRTPLHLECSPARSPGDHPVLLRYSPCHERTRPASGSGC